MTVKKLLGERNRDGCTLTLIYQLISDDNDMDALAERLAEQGCDDALVGVGKLGRLAFEFVRDAHFAAANYSGRDAKMQSPEGSRLRGFYFRLHPLMIGERGSENTR
ncbi:hypothetical protein [Pseudomonas mandelii]|uniref:hypothetical protein n=1 Tax=Pseudomonas mandelii TaxID=75612 RepID=UPI00224B9BC1|nr:hypothetical protein [Pseudomonas mandelii]